MNAVERDAARTCGGRRRLLALVAGQDVEPTEGSDGTDGRSGIARRTAPDRVTSTVDPETRHPPKSRERRQHGFKAHRDRAGDTGLRPRSRSPRPVAPRTATPLSGRRCSSAVPASGWATRRSKGRPSLRCPSIGVGTVDIPVRLGRQGTPPEIKPWPIKPAVEMNDLDVSADDIFVIVVEIHLQRRLRCAASGPPRHSRG